MKKMVNVSGYGSLPSDGQFVTIGQRRVRLLGSPHENQVYYSFVLHGLFARQAQNIFEQEGPEKTEAFVGSLYAGCDEPGSSCTEGFCDAMAHLGETSEYTVKKLHQLHNNYGLGISDDLEFAVAVRFED